jgi:hypothetical protein
MKQDKTTSIPRVFEVPGLKRREISIEDNDDHQLDASYSIHKDAILSRCSNAETDGGLAHCALVFVSGRHD